MAEQYRLENYKAKREREHIKRVYQAQCDVYRYLVLNTKGLNGSVGDPDPEPDPQGPHVFGPRGSGSGSVSQRYGSGSGSGSFPFSHKCVQRIEIMPEK